MNKVSYTKRALALMTSVMLTVSAPVVLADDEDLQDQLSSVQSQMAEQAQKKSEAEAVIGNVYENFESSRKILMPPRLRMNQFLRK